MVISEANTAVLHVYRALLREASYLPDDFARVYARRYISYRFRNAAKLTSDRLSEAQRQVRTLRRATEGQLKPLKDVLMHVYGRTGKRRRQLLAKFMRSMAPWVSEKRTTKGKDLFTLLTVPRQEVNVRNIHPAFAALLDSQARNKPPESDRVIRRLKPKIPETSIWGRPLAMKAERGKKEKFWVATLDRVLPPLPSSEWDRLRDLVTGVLPFEGPPRRRARSQQQDPPTLDMDHLRKSIGAIGRYKLVVHHQQKDIHSITPRFMRRIWAGIWSQCPKMSYNDETRVWSVRWGNSRSVVSYGTYPEIKELDNELLEGLDHLEQSYPKHQRQRKDRRKLEI